MDGEHSGPLAALPVAPLELRSPEKLETLETVIQRHIQAVLAFAGGNKSRAARILGIDRRTLYRKLGRGKTR